MSGGMNYNHGQRCRPSTLTEASAYTSLQAKSEEVSALLNGKPIGSLFITLGIAVDNKPDGLLCGYALVDCSKTPGLR